MRKGVWEFRGYGRGTHLQTKDEVKLAALEPADGICILRHSKVFAAKAVCKEWGRGSQGTGKKGGMRKGADKVHSRLPACAKLKPENEAPNQDNHI